MAETIINTPRREDVNAIAAAIAEQTAAMKAYFKTVQPDIDLTRSWEGFKALCQQGAVGRYFNVGDQLQCNKGSNTLTWDIVHIGDRDDGQNYVILQMHDCLGSDTMEFDNREAIFKATAEIPVGTYHFTTSIAGITDTNWTDSTKSGWSKTWQFTTTKTIPKGGVLCFANPKEWSTDLSTEGVSSFATNDTSTVIETMTITEGTGGTDLATLGTINHAQRICYGYNRYSQSNIRQWLNSKAAAGQWFTPQNDWDRPPHYSTWAGFMNDIDADFLAVISKSQIVTDINKISDNGGHDTTLDYFFLPCMKNINGGDNFLSSPGSAVQDIEDTVTWGYYTKFRMDGKTGANPYDDSNRAKRKAGYPGTIWSWWERSPYPAYAYYVRCVNPSGGCWWSVYAYGWFGVAPACRIN